MKSKKDNEKKQKQYFILFIMAAVVFTIVIFLQFLDFIRKSRDNEVASQLAEVYGQVNNQFTELSEKSWNLLYDGTLTYELSQDEELMDQYVAQLKTQWKFNKWLFVDENGTCIDTKGHTGYLNLGKSFLRLDDERENLVVDGTLTGSDPVLLFVIPTEENVYKGFTYSAAAIAYNKEALLDVLENNSYNGNSECYLTYPDGRIMFTLQKDSRKTYNMFTRLKSATFDRGSYNQVHDGINNGKQGALRFSDETGKYYLYYQPVGFQDWMMVGIVPQHLVGRYVDLILSRTTILSILFLIIMFSLTAGIFYFRSRREITQKDQELRYRESLFDILSENSSYLFIVLVPHNRRVEYVSSNSEQILGHSREEIMNDFSALNVEAEFLGHPDLNLDHLPLGETMELEAIRYHGVTGERRWFDETVHHVRFGEFERFILVLQDRTRERESSRNLKTALEVAKAANESKSAFLSNMSHDIRTPMNVIIGFLPMLQRDAENPEKVREYAGKIYASSHHLLSLINDILDMSKIESGKTSLNIGEFGLPQFIDDLTLIIRPQAKVKHQIFDIYVKDIVHETLLGDSMKLSQIMINILSNAVKYTPENGRICLTVQEMTQMTKNICSIRFTVSDTGIGMSEEYVRCLFDPFTREERSESGKTRGTGLGMSIVKSLVDLMGGSVSVESTPGEGSTFTVDLGLRIREEDVDSDFWAKHSLSRTLVVDDDKDVCESVVQTVTMSGLEMEYALSGEEAIEKVDAAYREKREYNLILLDWKMPGMNGLETARKVREVVPDSVPILVLTAYDWSDIEEEAISAGINGFLSKPFFLSNFKNTVEEICNPKTERRTGESGRSRLDGLHCLVAEDYELNAEILEGILEMYGVTCHVCGNGLEALQCFESSDEGTFDLVLMDIQMPVMNGYEATRAIRACDHPQAASIPIMAMSANAFAEDVREALAAGMNVYLTKPVDADLLEEKLMEYFGSR